MPIGDEDGWRQILADDFDTDVPLGQFPSHPATTALWSVYPDGWPDSTGHGTYMPSKVVSIKDSILNEHIHYEDGKACVVAILPKYTRMTYGRMCVRWRADNFPDYKMVWLLWPNSGNNEVDGEIDFPERNLDSHVVSGFLHRKLPLTQGDVTVPINVDPTVWHTTTVEWSPGLLVYILDGEEVYRTDVGVPSGPMHMVLQTESRMGGAPAPKPTSQGNVQIAWVVVYRYDTTARAPDVPRKVTLQSPVTATGIVVLGAVASSDVHAVKWMVDDVEVAYDAAAPFSRPFDSRRFANGVHSLWIKGLSEYWFNSPAKRTITINNPWDIVVPEVCTGTVQLGINQSYRWIKQVQWVVDDKLVGNDSAAPWQTNWNTTAVPNGTHKIRVKILGPWVNGQPKWVDGPTHVITVRN